jgi:hypothetical protein
VKLTATTTPADHYRTLRLLIAWSTGDKLALDVVLDEVMRDPTGVPGLIFSLAAFATDLGEQVADDFPDQLRQRLVQAAADEDRT